MTKEQETAISIGYQKMAAFQKAMETHIADMEALIEQHLANAGIIEADSQKLVLINRIKELEAAVNGTCEDDMRATEEELVAQLAWFCEEHDLPHMSADELMVEPQVTPKQRDWLEYFIERWNAIP